MRRVRGPRSFDAFLQQSVLNSRGNSEQINVTHPPTGMRNYISSSPTRGNRTHFPLNFSLDIRIFPAIFDPFRVETHRVRFLSRSIRTTIRNSIPYFWVRRRCVRAAPRTISWAKPLLLLLYPRRQRRVASRRTRDHE